MKNFNAKTLQRQRGFSFVEIMIGVLIFAVGMLALSSLQTSLTRSQADSNSRAVASGLAERIIERSKGFSDLGNEDGSALVGAFAYNEINTANIVTELAAAGGTASGDAVIVNVGGINYTIEPSVTDYYWNESVTPPAFTTAVPVGSIYSDFKQLDIAVSWDGADFIGAPADNGRLGSGQVNLSTVISSVTSPSSTKVQNSSNTAFLPPIEYTPGANPDIVSLNLGGSRFKESTLPEPRINQDQGETTWDVVTYAVTNNGDASFLRREEFRTVSCSCEFAGTDTRPEPVFWAGDEYLLGEDVQKVTGANVDARGRPTINSRLCDRCCENHHDDVGANGEGYRRYRPFDDDVTASGNHKHYNTDRSGNLIEVAETAGNEYLEACRMVRKDGFWQVAQDLRNEQRFVVPEGWLDDTAELETYSSYVVGTGGDSTRDGAVEQQFDAVYALHQSNSYPAEMPCWLNHGSCAAGLDGPTYSAGYPTLLEAGKFPSWTGVTYPSGSNQLRSRGLYIDFMHPDLLELIKCMEGDTAFDDLSCTGQVDPAVPGVGVAALDRFRTSNALEIMPFFEVQLTSLTAWAGVNPIEVTSEAISDRGFSRGLATANANGQGVGRIQQFRGSNNGLLDTRPHLPADVDPEIIETLAVVSGEGIVGDPGGARIFGSVSPADNAFKYSLGSSLIPAVNAENCSADSGGWSCTVADFALNPVFTVELSNVDLNSTNTYYLCSLTGELSITNTVDAQSITTAVIQLSAGGNPLASLTQNLVVQSSSCP